MKETKETKVREFFKENESKFGTKRQASKFLNKHGKVWKELQGIDLSAPKKGGEGVPPTPKSKKNRNKNKKKK
jgi:hypothetical protein